MLLTEDYQLRSAAAAAIIPAAVKAKDDPLVTVVVPAYNAARTLADTLRSVSLQSYANLEILIVDDGSSDRTAGIAADFCRRDRRATLLKQENGGVASARNLGIRHARGEFVAPIDADDIWHPTKIERQVEAALRAAEPPGFVYAFCRRVDEQGRVFHCDPQFTVRGPAVWRQIYWNVAGNGSSMLARRSAIIEAGGYDESQRAAGLEGNEDLLLQLQIAKHHPVECVPEYLVGYRLTQGAMSSDPDLMFQSWLRLVAIMRQDRRLSDTRVYDWASSRTRFALAVVRARQARFVSSALMLVRAAWADPVRTYFRLRYSGRRLAQRWLLPASPAGELPAFETLDVTVGPSYDPDRIPKSEARLLRLDLRRMERLKHLDAAFQREPAPAGTAPAIRIAARFRRRGSPRRSLDRLAR